MSSDASLAQGLARSNGSRESIPVRLDTDLYWANDGSLHFSLDISSDLELSLWAKITVQLVDSMYVFDREPDDPPSTWDIGPLRVAGRNPLAPEARMEFRRALVPDPENNAPGSVKVSAEMHVNYLRLLKRSNSVPRRHWETIEPLPNPETPEMS